MPLTRLQAIQQLATMVQSDEYPELNNEDLAFLIDNNKRSNDFAYSTAYVYGDLVEPIVKNGRLYKCIEAGTSGTINPFPTYYNENTYAIAFDTGTARFMDVGPANVEQFDVRSAARAGWILKAAKVANLINSKDGSQDLNLSALQEQFLKMAERYRPVVLL